MLSASVAPSNTAERLLVLLEALAASSGGLSFSELRSRLGDVPSVTVTRTLEPLLEYGFVVKEDSFYVPGPRFEALIRSAAGSRTLEDRLQPLLRSLAELSGHSAAFFHWDGEWAYVRLKVEIGESFHYASIGHRRHPATHTFLRPILAHLPKRLQRKLGVKIDSEVSASIVQRGVDEQVEYLHGRIYRLTAPVFYGRDGLVAGSIGITSLVIGLRAAEKRRLTQLVKSAAEDATDQLEDFDPQNS